MAHMHPNEKTFLDGLSNMKIVNGPEAAEFLAKLFSGECPIHGPSGCPSPEADAEPEPEPEESVRDRVEITREEALALAQDAALVAQQRLDDNEPFKRIQSYQEQANVWMAISDRIV